MTWHCRHRPAYDCRSGFNPCKCLHDEVCKRGGDVQAAADTFKGVLERYSGFAGRRTMKEIAATFVLGISVGWFLGIVFMVVVR